MREKVVRGYSRRAWLNDYVGVGGLTLIFIIPKKYDKIYRYSSRISILEFMRFAA